MQTPTSRPTQLLHRDVRWGMFRALRRTAGWAAMAAVIVAGCTKQVTQTPRQPPDPLLVSKKPVQGKPTSLRRGDNAVRIDPQPPEFPDMNARYATAQLSSDVQIKAEK